MRYRKALAGATGAALAVGVAVAVVALPGTAAAATALTANWYESAPYYYTLDSAAPDLGQVMSATGEKAYELAFILAPTGGGCTPTWDGTDPVSSDTQVAAVINEVRADGGDVSVSAGGASGTKLGEECGTPAATAAAYQSVITQYGLHAIDFDIEEPEIENATAVANELGAAQILQGEDSGLIVSVTIPTATSGANYFGQLLLNQAKSDGFVPDSYSLMPFDNGFSGGASSQESALSAFNTQLTTTFGWTSAQAWNHEGVSSMNGRSDTGEFFYQADFASMLTFAEQHDMSRYSFWSVNRDRQCATDTGTTSGECSSVTQNAYDFTKYDTQFAQWAPTTPPVTPPPPNAGGCAAPYDNSSVYTAGDIVSYNGDNWTANWWTQGGAPSGTSGAWTNDGPCTGSGSAPTSAAPTTAPPTTAAPTTAPPTTTPPTTTPPTTSAPTTAAPTTSAPTGSGVVNGGFETGSLSPWTCDSGTAAVVGSPVHSGSYALQGTPSSSDDAQCSQVIAVSPSHTYTLSGWVDGSYVYLGVSGTGTSDTSTWTAGTSGYQQLTDSFTTGSSTTSVTVYVHGWYGEPVYNADDISVG